MIGHSDTITRGFLKAAFVWVNKCSAYWGRYCSKTNTLRCIICMLQVRLIGLYWKPF